MTTCSDFPSEAMCYGSNKEVEMVDTMEGFEVIATSCGQEVPEFRNAGREECIFFEQDHPKLPLEEEGQSRGT